MAQPSRYLPTYRQEEVSRCCEYAARGDSLCFVGIAGIGKSNIVKVLTQDRDVKARYLNSQVETVRFVAIDANTWDGTPQKLWELLLGALLESIKSLTQPVFDPKITYLSEEEKMRKRVQLTIDLICQQLGYQLMIVLDDFDSVFVKGPLHMIEQLNVFRSAGNRERLSYLVFTKRLPHVLGRAFEMDTSCKFYDLFRTSVFALEPYTTKDARHMLRHLNRQLPNPLAMGELSEIEWLCGGHARLLKVILDSWNKRPPPSGNRIAYFAAQSDVQEECRRVLKGLHAQECAVAIRFARGENRSEDDDTLDHLWRRGLLLSIAQSKWFSPVWAEYLHTHAQA